MADPQKISQAKNLAANLPVPGYRGTNLSHAQFKGFVQTTAKHGGASMDATTGHIYQPGEDAYMVGQAPSVHGPAVQTQVTAGGGPARAAAAHRSITRQTGGRPGVAMGSWKDRGSTEIDASEAFSSRAKALGVAEDRGEKAIFGMKDMEEIPTSHRNTVRDYEK
jgi:hypothetical protein